MLTLTTRRCVAVCFVFGLIAGLAADIAEAQFRSRRRSTERSVFSQVRDRRVVDELDLKDDVVKKIREIESEARMKPDAYRKFTDRMKKASTKEEKAKIGAELTAAVAKTRKDAEQTALKLLSEAQRTRLEQLKWRLHPARVSVLVSTEAVEALKITDEQKKKIEEVLEARGKAAQDAGLSRRSPPDAIKKFQAEWDPKTVAVLTPDQQKQWQSMIGPELKADRAATKTAATPAGGSSSTPAATPAAPAAQTTVSPKDYVASFDPSTAEQRKQAAVAYGAAPQRNGTPATRPAAKKKTPAQAVNGTLSFNFTNAPWQVVLEFFAKKTGLSLEMTKSPPDTFTYQDPNLYTPTQALDVLNGVLLQKNFILVRRYRSLVLHDLSLPVPQSLIPDVSPAELAYRGSNELMRVTFKFKQGVNPEEVTKDVKDLAGTAPYAAVSTFATSNRVIVTNIGSTLMRIDDAMLDIWVEPEPDKLTFKRFPLMHVSAKDAVEKISKQLGIETGVTNVSAAASSRSSSRSNPFDRFRGGRSRSRTGVTEAETVQFQFGGRGGGRRDRGGSDRRAQFFEMMRARAAGGSNGGSRFGSSSRNAGSRFGNSRNGNTRRNGNSVTPRVSADMRTNAVLVTASLEQVNIVEQIVLAIDVPQMEESPFAVQEKDDAPYLKVYKVYKGDVREITKTLDVLVPGVVVNEDARNSLIHIMATRADHAYVSEALVQLDGGSTAGGGGVRLAQIPLRSLDPVPVVVTLNAMFADERENAPSIQADAAGRRILVKGTEAQIASLTSFVKSLEGEGANGINSAQTGNTRSLVIPGDPTQFAEQLKRALDGGHRGVELNIVVPSAPNPIQNRVVPGADGSAQPRRGLRRPFGDQSSPRRATSDLRTRTFSVADNHRRPVDERGYVKARQRDFGVSKSEPTPRPPKRRTPTRSATRGNLNEISALLEQDAGDVAEQPAKSKTDSKSAPKTKASGSDSGTKSRVSIIVRDGQLIITSDDPAALDRVYQVAQTLLQTMPNKTTWTVFYLRTADATQTAAMLEQIFPASSVASTDTGGGLMGGLTSGLSNFGSSVMDMTGLNSLGQTGALRIIPDLRSNSLFVSGSPSKVRDVERVLKILDEDNLPASLRDRVPRMIPVYYANVYDVYQNVAEVYKDYMQPTRGGGGGANVLAMLAGGGGRSSRGGRGGRGGQQQQPQQLQLTLSVDERTGQLIVSSSDALFQQIDDLVYSIDKAAYDAKPISRVVQLENVTPTVVSQTLTSMYPNVSVSVTNNSQRSRTTNGSSQQGQSQGNDIRNAMRAQFMQQMMGGNRGRGTSRTQPGGTSDRGNFNFGGGRQSGGRSPFGGGSRGGGGRGGGGRGGRRGR